MKKTLLLSILLISTIIISNCGKGVITGPSSNKSTATNEIHLTLTINDLLSEITNMGDLYFNYFGSSKKFILASFQNVQHDEINTNKMTLTLVKGPEFYTTQYSANRDLIVKDALLVLNTRATNLIEENTNSAISNMSFSFLSRNSEKDTITVKLNIELKENAETDIDTNDITLNLRLGSLRYNQRPDVFWASY